MSPFLLHRTLRQHRVALAIGFVLAGIAAVLTLYTVSSGLPPELQSRKHHVGFAAQRVLVDTARSQVSSQGGGAPADGTAASLFGLVRRANLLAGLATTSEFGRRIAAGAGLKGRSLIVIPPDGLGPQTGGRRVEPDELGPKAISLEIAVDELIPVITLGARAPDAATARRVTDSAARRLREYVSEQAASHHVPEAERLTALPTGDPTSETVVIGPQKLFAVAVFLLLIALWSAGLVVCDRVAVHWRSVGDRRGRPDGARGARRLREGTSQRPLPLRK
jgi:hypothetical protein